MTRPASASWSHAHRFASLSSVLRVEDPIETGPGTALDPGEIAEWLEGAVARDVADVADVPWS